MTSLPPMDAVVGSINILDLLSSTDLDTSSPLSAPDLCLLIDRLKLHSLSIRSNVLSLLLSHRPHFLSIISSASISSSLSASLSSSLSSLLSDLPLDTDIALLVKQIVATRRELAEKEEAKGVIAVVADVVEGVRASREEMGMGRVTEAAERMRALKGRLRFGEEEDGEPAVFGMLRAEWSDCFDEVFFESRVFLLA